MPVACQQNLHIIPDESAIFSESYDTEMNYAVSSNQGSLMREIHPSLIIFDECRLNTMAGGSVAINNIKDEVITNKLPKIEVTKQFCTENGTVQNKVLFNFDKCDIDKIDLEKFEVDRDEEIYKTESVHSIDRTLAPPDDESPQNLTVSPSSSCEDLPLTPPSSCKDVPLAPPSGCQDLPGTRFSNLNNNNVYHGDFYMNGVVVNVPEYTNQIHVSATLKFPPNANHCQLNITATRDGSASTMRSRSPPPPYSEYPEPPNNPQPLKYVPEYYCSPRNNGYSNNFNGGGIVKITPSLSMRDLEENPLIEQLRFYGCRIVLPAYEQFSKNLDEVRRKLRMSGWYYENIGWQESAKMLKNVESGRWLLRDSKDENYEFALTVKTNTFTTSIRIKYCYGKFRFDADSSLMQMVPTFNCVYELIEDYIQYSKNYQNDKKRIVWIDCMLESFNQIYISHKPLYHSVPSLMHLSRVKINQRKLDISMLPSILQNYCRNYPYKF